MTVIAKIFMSGRSQAIRLPASYGLLPPKFASSRSEAPYGFSPRPCRARTWLTGSPLFIRHRIPCPTPFLPNEAIAPPRFVTAREPPMRRTLDTTIGSYILRRHLASVIERFSDLDRWQVWLSAIVAAELRFGAARLASTRFAAAIEAWLSGFELRPWPTEATHHYATICAALERVGQPIGGMDLLIAAHAIAEDSVLVTNNAREILRVPGLAVEEWDLQA